MVALCTIVSVSIVSYKKELALPSLGAADLPTAEYTHLGMISRPAAPVELDIVAMFLVRSLELR